MFDVALIADNHCTAKCSHDGAPVHEPPGGQSKHPTCCWCGIRVHSLGACLQRVPDVLAPEQKRTAALRSDHGIQKGMDSTHTEDMNPKPRWHG